MHRQTTVAKNRSRDYNPAMHVVNAPPTLPKHKAKKSRYQKKGMTNYRKKEGDLASNTCTCYANSTPTPHSMP